MILYDIHNLTDQRTGLPCKGTAGFKYDAQMRIALA